MAGRTQAALYSEIDLELSWSEDDLPQVERTKHVHGLHPYLGKYIPQLVEAFLGRCFRPGDVIYDPFVGSGTTLVEANAYGSAAVGADISAFNCLLARVKAARYSLGSLELRLLGVLEQSRSRVPPDIDAQTTAWLRAWFAPVALEELVAYRSAANALDDDVVRDAAHLILSRAARSARLTTHFDLDFPRVPIREPYYCHKHKRICRPVDEAWKFLVRYTGDTVRRIRRFAELRHDCETFVVHADARTICLPIRPAGVITSPPYPGLIDYHEQHRYAYELLGLVDRRHDEIGPATQGTSKVATAAYVDSMVTVLRNTALQLPSGAPMVIVVNDSRNLYPEVLDRAELALHDVVTRHVNRRTGRRAGEFFESVLICATR